MLKKRFALLGLELDDFFATYYTHLPRRLRFFFGRLSVPPDCDLLYLAILLPTTKFRLDFDSTHSQNHDTMALTKEQEQTRFVHASLNLSNRFLTM